MKDKCACGKEVIYYLYYDGRLVPSCNKYFACDMDTRATKSEIAKPSVTLKNKNTRRQNLRINMSRGTPLRKSNG